MLTSLVSLQQGNVKKSSKSMKIANIGEENLHIFWTRWGIFMIFSGKMWILITLKVAKKQGGIKTQGEVFIKGFLVIIIAAKSICIVLNYI